MYSRNVLTFVLVDEYKQCYTERAGEGERDTHDVLYYFTESESTNQSEFVRYN